MPVSKTIFMRGMVWWNNFSHSLTVMRLHSPGAADGWAYPSLTYDSSGVTHACIHTANIPTCLTHTVTFTNIKSTKNPRRGRMGSISEPSLKNRPFIKKKNYKYDFILYIMLSGDKFYITLGPRRKTQENFFICRKIR